MVKHTGILCTEITRASREIGFLYRYVVITLVVRYTGTHYKLPAGFLTKSLEDVTHVPVENCCELR